MNLRIMGRRYRGVIDTGSTNSYINQQVYNECKNRAYQDKVKTREIVLANGIRTQAHDNLLVDIVIKEVTIRHWLRVLPSATDIIIGMDILKRLGMSIKWPGESQDEEDDRNTQKENQENREEKQIVDTLEENQKSTTTESSQQQPTTPLTQVQHRIELEQTEPVKHRYYPRNPKQQEIIDKHASKMYRPCVDFRKINQKTEKDAYLIPQIKIHHIREKALSNPKEYKENEGIPRRQPVHRSNGPFSRTLVEQHKGPRRPISHAGLSCGVGISKQNAKQDSRRPIQKSSKYSERTQMVPGKMASADQGPRCKEEKFTQEQRPHRSREVQTPKQNENYVCQNKTDTAHNKTTTYRARVTWA
ncbi:uncharacterized protein LOC133533964 [Cydia pomonella]|uniref:uncharacterized protein LOC133533964 n=1 Tax=Cydia pomonella TaxID=82600 RepID=UPI002ADDAAAF|nr:uncharacterized protein LOC133533964 [Cydia pomonella]